MKNEKVKKKLQKEFLKIFAKTIYHTWNKTLDITIMNFTKITNDNNVDLKLSSLSSF